MHEDLDLSASKALFSLPTGLEIAQGVDALQSVARAKQASVLFDEIVVESGLRVVEISPGGVLAVIDRNAGELSQALVEATRTLPEDAKAGIAVVHAEGKVQLYLGTNLPRIEGAQYTEKEVTSRYIGEYHSGILEDLSQLKAPWVRVVSILRNPDGESKIRDEDLSPLPTEAESADLVTKVELEPDEADELAALLIKGLTEIEENREGGAKSASEEDVLPAVGLMAEDLTDAIDLGRRLKAVPALSSAFAEVASQRGVPVGLPGAESLGFIVPNFSILPWQAVAEFRDHPGSIEARGKLREFEAQAASSGPNQSTSFVRSTGQAVTGGLIGAVKDLAPSLPDEIGRQLSSTAVGLVPVIGQYASLAISVGDMISALRQHEQFEESWLAAVFQLRDAASESLVDW